MKKSAPHLTAEVPRRQPQVATTIGIDLGDVWSHYCTLNQDGEVVDRGRFRTTPKGIDTWFTDVPHARVAMEARMHSIWISEQLQELGHEVIVANVRELRAISHSDRKSDQVDAEKLARYARLDPEILRPIAHRTVEQQQALTLIRARDLIVRLRTASVNAVRGLTKPCGHRMPASTTSCFAKRSLAAMPPGLAQALGSKRDPSNSTTVGIQETNMTQAKSAVGKVRIGSTAVGALAVGAVAFGAVAIGALAMGAMTVRRLRVLEARIEKLSIGTLTVDRLNLRPQSIHEISDSLG